MLKLYGFPVSNYFNMVKLALLEKGVAFEEVTARPSQKDEFRARSPMGKIPCLEVAEGFISETDVILDYIEALHPGHFPTTPFAQAKARELMRVMELYIELPARRHFGHALFGAPINQAALEEVKPAVEKGLAALKQLAGSGPWLGGASFSLLDIYAYYTFGYAGMVLSKVYQWDILAEVPDVAAILDKVKARATTQSVDAAQQLALAALMAPK